MRTIIFLYLRLAVDKIFVLMDRFIAWKKDSQDTSHLENQIDQLVYRLYGLTPEEIRVVEASEQNLRSSM